MSPTARSLAYLKKQGWTVDVVERWIPGANVRRDLYGFGDLLALRLREIKQPGMAPWDHPEILIVQTTSYSNMSARIRKITDSEHIALVRKCGIMVWVMGWRKVGRRWQVEVEDMS